MAGYRAGVPDYPHAVRSPTAHARIDQLADEMQKALFFTVKPSELLLESPLGQGAQASVYKAAWTRSFGFSTTSILVAVKHLHSDVGEVYRNREWLTRLTDDHPNLVKCFDSTLSPPYLVINELCAGGSLFDLLYKSEQALYPHQQLKILLDVAAGMRYLHAQNPPILHRDLKSSNVLLSNDLKSTSHEPLAKVADFGLARVSDHGSASGCLTIAVGTWRWMAPEVFGLDAEDTVYNDRADVFSFAMLMYEVLERRLPYSETYPTNFSDPRIALHVCMGMRPHIDQSIADVSASQFLPKLRSLTQRAWSNEAADRPSFQTLENILSGLYAEERELAGLNGNPAR